jgi:Tn7-like transposition protein D
MIVIGFFLHQPAPWKRSDSARQLDWRTRDREYAGEVYRLAAEIKNRVGKPIWVRQSSIAHEIKHREWITHSKYKKKLPLTKEALQDVTETRIEYNLRRIRWAIESIKEDGSSYAVSFIGQRAVVAWHLWREPRIKKALDEGIEEIKRHRSLIQ